MIIHGFNLVPEGLETGEFVVAGTGDFEELKPAYMVAYIGDSYVDRDGNSHPVSQIGYSYNGIYSAITFVVCDQLGFQFFMEIMQYGDNSSKVITCFTVPQFAVQDALDEAKQHDYKFKIMEDIYEQAPITKTLVGVPAQIDGYTPRNQKLRTYPYLYLAFNPSNGSAKVYRYEDFTQGLPSFKILSEVNPNPSVCFIPQNYRGKAGDSLQDTSTLSGYPTISYKTDYYNTWLAQNEKITLLNVAQNQYNYEVGQVQTAVSGYSNMLNQAIHGDLGSLGTATNLGLEMASNDVNHDYYIKNQLAQVEKQQMIADSGTLSSSNATLLGYELLHKNIFTRFNIKRQFAERIDKFFDAYGYLTNQIKIPNLSNRPNWNYVKLIGANILASIPQRDLEMIKNLFNNGITLWHDPNTFLNYSANNR